MEGEAKSKTKYLIIYKTMATRNIDQEKLALKKYQSIYKKNPTTPSDWSSLHKLAYPTGVPEELKTATNESLGAAGISDPLSQTVEGSNLNQLRSNVDTAKANVEKTSQPNEALRVLQEAIRTKSGQAEQPIGTSKLFESAGLTGIGSLNASLTETTNKFKNDFTNFSNIVSQMSGTYKDMASAALNNYDMAYKEFTDEANRLQKIQDNLTAYEQQINLAGINYENDKKLKLLEAKFKRTPEEIAAAESAGLEWSDEKGYTSKVDTIFESPSSDTYDVAKYAQLDDGTPNPEHINNMRFAVEQMKQLFPNTNGQMKSAQDIDKYIQTYYPGSPIKSSDIMAASAKYGIDWETIIATMVAETQMGTDGSKGSQGYNFGNVGNTNELMSSGGSKSYPTIQSGVEAVAKTMSLPYYKRNQLSTNEDKEIEANLDDTSKSILSVTGLSLPAFSYLTTGTSALTRMTATQRLKYMNEAEEFLNKTGTDVSTFQSQYNALGKTVEANSLRNNQAAVAESELDATIQNLKTAADESDFKKLRWANVAKLFAGKEVNNATVIKYAFHLQQLRSEFAMYNAAIAGQIDANGNIREISDSDKAVADNIIKEGLAKEGIDGFENALKASREKMKTVLSNSIDAQNKQVWKLFGVEDKYQSTSNTVMSGTSTATGNKYTVTKE